MYGGFTAKNTTSDDLVTATASAATTPPRCVNASRRSTFDLLHIVKSLNLTMFAETNPHARASAMFPYPMPNTPCLVGAAASGLCVGSTCTEDDRNKTLALMSAVGVCKVIMESQMSALTGVSGSGPAYIFILIEAMADGGVRAGLPRDVALELAAQTFYGAAKMVLETKEHPGVLKDRVCSPGGTTITAVHALEQAGARQAMMNAVVAAAKRGDELAKSA